jgi:hypothetical protein
MYISAKLSRDGKTVSDGIKFNKRFDVATEHIPMVGHEIVVVAGPHKDFDEPDVYTVKVLWPTKHDLPFFNSKGLWDFVTINVV